MGLMYTAQFNAVAVAAQQDFFELVAPADAVVVLHSLYLSQVSEVADAQEEGLALLFKRGATTSGTGGTAPTPAPLEFGFPAAGSVVEVNNTTKASVGTIVTLHADNWNVRMPYLWVPTPECRLVLSPSQRATIELATTPADSITMSATLVFEELGG